VHNDLEDILGAFNKRKSELLNLHQPTGAYFEALSALSNPYAVPRKNPENNQSQRAGKKSSAR
jgi:hypothetical protein